MSLTPRFIKAYSFWVFSQNILV